MERLGRLMVGMGMLGRLMLGIGMLGSQLV